MSDHPKPTAARRRWLRFSLRSSLIAVTLIAVLLAAVGNLLHTYFVEQRIAREITDAGGYVEHTLCGEVPAGGNPRDWGWGPRWLQRVVGVRLSGTDIDDEHLAQLDLQRFKHLRWLEIGYFAVFGTNGPKWEHMPAPITDSGIANLPPFPELRYVGMWDMPIGDAGLSGLAAKYPRLEGVDLWGTRVTDASMAELGQLEHLKHVILRETCITDAGLVHLARCENLMALDASDTRIVGAGFEQLVGLHKLRRLDLSATDVNDNTVCHLAGFEQLQVLQLDGTTVGDEGIGHLQGLQELTNLDLADTEITDVGLEELAEMPNLEFVGLEGTNVTISGVRAFLGRRSNRTVRFNNEIMESKDVQHER